MAVDRLTPTTANYGATIGGTAYANEVAEEVAALWLRAPERLTSVAGTNTITATSSPAYTALAAGNTFILRPAATNSGATTLNINSLGAKTVRTSAGAALSGGELVSGTDYLCWYDGTDVRILSQVSTSSITAITRSIFGHTAANTTAGGTATAVTWTKYPLATTHENSISGCSIASSVITLPNGTYYVDAEATFYKTNSARLRLRDTSGGGSSVTLLGTTPRGADGSSVGVTARLRGKFTVSGGPKTHELQYYVEDGETTSGLGNPSSSGETELYGFVVFEKVA